MPAPHSVDPAHRSRADALRRRGDDGAVPAPAPAGRARLHARRADRRPARADPAGRRPSRWSHTLSELGVILLMFSLGLEFSLRKLVRGRRRRPGVAAVIQCSLMIWLGFVVGRAVRLDDARERSSPARIIAISSTTIIAKAFDEQGITGRLRELVVGILIVEDLIAILLLAIAHGDRARARGLSARRAGADRRAAGRLPGRLLVGRAADRAARRARGRAAAAAPRPRWWPASASASRSRCWRAASATRWRWARSSPARWSPSRARPKHRAPGPAGARHVRRDLLRLGRAC